MARAVSFFLAVFASSRLVQAQQPGSFQVVGKTLVSAMMMFLGNDDKVYILDKSENNPTWTYHHPAMGAVWDIATNKAEVVETVSNAFCAAGYHMPNGSWATFGGNHAVTPSTSQPSGVQDYDGTGAAPTYGDIDGRKTVRVVKPCTGSAANFTADCQWFDDPSVLSMQEQRWYATAEALGDGSIALIGGMVNGGYINRDARWFTYPEARDPVGQHTQAQNNIEFYPARPGFTPKPSQFLVNAGGLNTYAITYLLKSGDLFLQANVSTITLNTATLVETPLPDMPNGVVRVYPASAGVAMLPLTPENNYNPTILFCGGTNALTDEEWGTYSNPNVNTWERRASADCQRITPEPEDGSEVAYVQDDDMPDPRTMGQFIQLPDGKLLMINGARNGTAGYAVSTPTIPTLAKMPYWMSLATEEVLTPAIYDPSAPVGQRWNTTGLGASTIPRLYHSSAVLLPDGSVLVAGSNPGADVTTKNASIPYPTTYDAEIFYPPYWGKTRPSVTGIPTDSLTYGGAYFNVSVAKMDGDASDLASKTKVVLLRSGFSTHGMQMGQRYLQLNSTYTVESDGGITLHVSQPPPNANIFTPGPALMYVVVDGVPSVGTHVIVGSGKMEQQSVSAAVVLPVSSSKLSTTNGLDSTGSTSQKKSSRLSQKIIIAIAVAALLLAVFIIAVISWFILKKHRRHQLEEGASAAPSLREQLERGASGRGSGRFNSLHSTSSIVISKPQLQPYVGSMAYQNAPPSEMQTQAMAPPATYSVASRHSASSSLHSNHLEPQHMVGHQRTLSAGSYRPVPPSLLAQQNQGHPFGGYNQY